MKVILSRKGFEPTHGGIPSPIMPDGTLLLLPKPVEDGAISYHDLSYKGLSYYDIVLSLDKLQKESLDKFRTHSGCYIMPENHTPPLEWYPAYFHNGLLESHLNRQNISVGDIFLFYGWFRQTEYDNKHQLRFVPDAPELNIVFAYFQIGAIIKDISFFSKQYNWQLHTFINKTDNVPSTIYLPTKKLSYNNHQPGCDILPYSSGQILTKPGYHYYQWQLPEFLCAPDVTITYHNNRNNGFISGKNYFKASAICEEFVIHGTYDLKQWVHSMIHTLEFAATEQEEINELRLIPHNNYPDDNKQIYCRQLNSVVDYESLNCLGCQAAINCAEPDCIQCQWRDYVSRKEGNLSIVNPYEEYRRVNWLLDKRLLPEHMTV